MPPKPNQELVILFIQATLLSTIFNLPGFLCQNNQRYSNCSQPFQCGTLTNLNYPFWGGNRPLSCGYPGFELDCHSRNVPLLNISPLTYRVLEIDFSTHTLRVARQDLWNTTCPTTLLYNTTLNPLHVFEFPPDSNDENVTLYFDCTDNNTLRNQFTCDVNGVTTLNMFRTGNGALLSGTGTAGITCNNSVSVPVNQTAARALESPTANLSINVLQDALASGFLIQWSVDTNEVCKRCQGSGGTCVYNHNSLSIVCYMESAQVATSLPEPVGSRGMDPVQSPESSGFYPNGDGGWPPVQSPESSGFYPDGDDVLFSTRGSSNETGLTVGVVLGVTLLIIIIMVCCIRRRCVLPMPPVQSPQSGGTNRSGWPPPVQSPESSDQVVEVYPEEDGGPTAGAGFGVALLIIIIIVCCISRRCPQGGHNQESNLNVEQFLLQHGSLALKRYKYSEIKRMTKSLSDKLGQGGYGSVYKGKLPDGSLVAVKVLSATDSNGEDFINEVASISRTSHVNIVNLLGFSFDSEKRALVYEYMPNKSLDKYIGNSTGSDNLDLEKLYKIAVGVAKGLEYLHTGCNTRIVHFDIKPQNILLDEDFCPKISDFGLAKLCKKKQSLLSVLGTRGTAGYIAPEVFSRNFGGVSHKSDVYSYGMMVLEMAGANTIVDQDETTQSSENYFPDKIYERVLDFTRKLDDFMIEEEEETARKMLLVGFWCIQTNPTDRPSISKVLEMLEGSLQSIQIPPNPVLFTPTLPVLEFSSSFSSYVETEPSTEGITQT